MHSCQGLHAPLVSISYRVYRRIRNCLVQLHSDRCAFTALHCRVRLQSVGPHNRGRCLRLDCEASSSLATCDFTSFLAPLHQQVS